MNVIIDQKTVKLDEQAILGTGGEAVVLRHGQQAVKLYHTPSQEKARKLTELLRLQSSYQLPGVVFPTQLVQNVKGVPIGFVMAALPANFVTLSMLSHKNYRQTHSDITLGQISQLFSTLYQSVAAIHQAGLVIGDFNDLNVMIGNSLAQAYFIDVDSYQFGRYPCPVATEAFVDPQLYGTDLAAKPCFKPENDWYSYAVLLFRSLLLVHPYGGTHPRFKNLTTRARERVPVFDPEVIYPKIGLSTEFLDDALNQLFHQIFALGWRGSFPVQLLQTYVAQLRRCASCQNEFPTSRRNCPLCNPAGVIFNVMQPSPILGSVQLISWLEAGGPIIDFWWREGCLYAVCREGQRCVLYSYREGKTQLERLELFNWQPGTTFAFWADCLVVNPPYSDDLLILQIAEGKIQPLLKTTTGSFDGKAVFAANERYLYRTAGNMLMRGELRNGTLIESSMAAIMPGQTWFTSPAATNDAILGFSRVMREWEWFRLDNQNGYCPLKLAPLAAGESVLGYTALGDNYDSLLVRQTRQAGIDYLRLDNCGNDGANICNLRRLTDPTENTQFLAGAIYKTGIVLWPGEQQLVKEKVGKLPTSLSIPSLNSTSRLIYHSKGLLVATDNKINLLSLS